MLSTLKDSLRCYLLIALKELLYLYDPINVANPTFVYATLHLSPFVIR